MQYKIAISNRKVPLANYGDYWDLLAEKISASRYGIEKLPRSLPIFFYRLVLDFCETKSFSFPVTYIHGKLFP